MQIPFNLTHAFEPGSSEVENAFALRALMRCLVELNMAYLTRHPNTPPLYRSGVVYGRTLFWEPIPALYRRRFGDCKSLAAALIAEKLLRGEPAVPTFRYQPQPDGKSFYHILVRTNEGIEDPSKVLGMKDNEFSQFIPQITE